MIISVRDDYGTLETTFSGFKCYICDNDSYVCLETIRRYLLRRSELLNFDRFDLDTDNGVCSVYADDGFDDSLLPVLKFRIKNRLFDRPSNLLTLYNMFASRKARIHI